MMFSALRAAPVVALVAVACLVVEPAFARELVTSIDIDYTYSQEKDLLGDVKASTTYNQKYELRYTTSLSSDYDFTGAVRVDLADAWYTNQAGTSKVAPTLELEVKGSKLAAKVAYEGSTSTTDEYQETGESTTYSNSLSTELQLVPDFWPEVNLKYKRTREYEEWTADSLARTFEFSTNLDVQDLRLEFNLMRGESETILPTRTTTSDIQWSGKATFKHLLWADTGFEIDYEIKESYNESQTQGIFSSNQQTYSQTLKTQLQNTLDLSPRARVGLSWEYNFDQDLLELDYDYKINNKYLGELSWDLMDWLKLTGGAQRETNFTEAIVGEEGDQGVIDTLRAGFDFSLIDWLRVAGKTEYKNDRKIPAGKGGSIDQVEEEKSELAVKNKFGTFWDLTLSATNSLTNTNGWTTDREDKLKGDLKLRFYDLNVSPSLEATRKDEFDEGESEATKQTQSEDAKIKFDYKLQVLDMIAFTFSHEYGLKTEDSLDSVLNFEEAVTFTENTTMNIVITDLIPDLELEGEYNRSGSDTEDDSDPLLVDVSYTLKIDWKTEDLNLSSSFKYNDKGDTYDDFSFNARLSWKRDNLGVSGEYQFDKTLAENSSEEKRKLNLKLMYKF